MRDLLKEEIPWEERVAVGTDGAYTIERVRTQWDYNLEGFLLGHSLGDRKVRSFGKDHEVFSVRETDTGLPHATVLCIRRGKRSQYGRSSDLGTHKSFKLGNRRLKVLQVRGRCDTLARPEYLAIVGRWFQENGGTLQIPLKHLLEFSAKRGDQDEEYHFGYKLDESKNSERRQRAPM